MDRKTLRVFEYMSAVRTDRHYWDKVGQYAFWDNKPSNSVPQTTVARIIKEHFEDSNGKTKKAVIIGFDGVRADCLTNIIASGVKWKNGDDKYSGCNFDAFYSGIRELKKRGGLYLSYAGGEKGTSSKQSTATSAGWCAINTGVWGEQNGITENSHTKNLQYKTLLLQLAESGKKTGFYGVWGSHFSVNYKSEIEYLKQNKSVSMEYLKLDDDAELLKKMQEVLSDNDGADMSFCSFEAPDSNGHSSGFGNMNRFYVNALKNLDNAAYGLIAAIEARPNYANEDWLIIITTDHGGHGYGHGDQSAECKTTWLACNKKVDSKYFSKNFNGYKDKK